MEKNSLPRLPMTPKKTLFNAAKSSRMPTPRFNKKVPYLTWSELLDSAASRQIIELGHTNAEGGSELSKCFDPPVLASPAD